DAFRFVSQPLTGDGVMIARVASVQNTNAWAKVGVMIRETLASNAKYAASLITPSNGFAHQWRSSTGGSSSQYVASGITAPYWVKLVRSGSSFTSYYSPDGATWTTGTTVNVSMANNAYVGLAVTSHNNSALCTAVFDNLSVSGNTVDSTPPVI